MNIVLLESLNIPNETLEAYAAPLKEKGHTFTAYNQCETPKIKAQRALEADVLLIANSPLDADVINACPKLKFIDVAFTGVDHVDLGAAKARRIAVSNASGYATQAVAETALCMMLSLLRNMRAVEDRCRASKTKEGLVGRELSGMTVGFVGLGKIGKRTAELCQAFGCKILAYVRHPEKSELAGAEYTTLDDMLRRSDIVSLHCPLTAETRGLINKERIGLMKPGALLINTARGPVVNSEALAQALEQGRLGGAGIDVFEMEPPIPENHPLLQAPHTILTPHMAFASQESMLKRAQIVFDNLDAWLDGKQQNIILNGEEAGV